MLISRCKFSLLVLIRWSRTHQKNLIYHDFKPDMSVHVLLDLVCVSKTVIMAVTQQEGSWFSQLGNLFEPNFFLGETMQK